MEYGRKLRERIGRHETCGENEKNRDIGYALATNSCEGVDVVDTCTVAVPDAISAFAVPNPKRLLRRAVGFFGSGRRASRPALRITQPTSVGNDYEANPFGHRRTNPSPFSGVVNARFLCNQRVGNGSVNDPDGRSVKAFADTGRNLPQRRHCRPVEIFSRDEHKEPRNSLDVVNHFHASCCQESRK